MREVQRGQTGDIVKTGVGELGEEVAGEVEAPQVEQVPQSVTRHTTDQNGSGLDSFYFDDNFCCQFFNRMPPPLTAECRSLQVFNSTRIRKQSK